MKWHKSNYTGVRYREHDTRRHGVNFDRYFAIRYKADGKTKEEGLGWASEGWTAEAASLERAELRKNQKTGQGATSLKEKRDTAEAERKAERKEKERQNRENVSFKFFFDEIYKPIAQTNKKPESFRKEQGLFDNWIKPEFGQLPIKNLSPFHLEKLKKNMLDKGKAPRTIQYCFAVVRQVWNTARRAGYVHDVSPTKDVSLPKIDNERQRFLTKAESDDLLSEVRRRSEQLYQLSLLSLHCGLRAGEVFKLRYGDIKIDQGTIMVQSPKGGKSRVAFMTNMVKEILRDIGAGPPSELIFKSRDGQQITSVSNAFDRAVDAAGLNDGVDNPKQKVVFHSLRHTYASWLVQSGVDLYTVQKLMGHCNFKMTERYAHLGENTMQAAVRRLENSLTTEGDGGRAKAAE